jgi:hypothetical protein
MTSKEWARLATKTRIAIVLVHHRRELNGGEVTVESSGGASALVVAARLGLTLNTMTKAEDDGCGIAPDQWFEVWQDLNLAVRGETASKLKVRVAEPGPRGLPT